jgi:hypothetical protein
MVIGMPFLRFFHFLLANIRCHCNAIVMKNTKIARRQARIEQIKRQLSELGPISPGSLSQQWNVCGRDNCRCKDPCGPRKHGPYYQLSYTWRAKSHTVFVKANQVAEVKEKLANYRRFKNLCQRWVDLALAEFRQQKKR